MSSISRDVSDEPSELSEMTNLSEYSGRLHPVRRLYAQDDIHVDTTDRSALAAITTSKDDLVLAYKTSGNKVQYIRANKDLLLPWARTITARLVAAGMLQDTLTEEVETARIRSNTKFLAPSINTSKYGTKNVNVPIKQGRPRETYKLSREEIKNIGDIKESCNIDVCSCSKDDIAKHTVKDDFLVSGILRNPTQKYGQATAGTSGVSTTGIEREHQSRFGETKQKMRVMDTDQVGSLAYPKAQPQYVFQAQEDEEDINLKPPGGLSKHEQTTAQPGAFESYITDIRHFKWTRNDFVDYRDINHTGYFRDQRRRVDMILVIDDTANPAIERIKDQFFINIINAGIEVELEMGVLPKNSGLVFMKLHAPDAIILALSKHFGLRKYFKNNHLEFSVDAAPDEKDIIKCVRRNYPGPYSYSTIDRITIVFRLLRLMPFGIEENHRGIERLLDRGIIRHVYPLHDGPYYVMDKADNTINGRQALHENWTGSENILRRQPVNTIREYLGERIAFLFAYFEFYNFCLIATWAFGISITACGYFSKSNDIITTEPMWPPVTGWWSWVNKFNPGFNFYTYTWTYTLSRTEWRIGIRANYKISTYYDMPICPKCKDFKACPFVNLTNYCLEVKLKNLIDNPFNIYSCAFIFVWGDQKNINYGQFVDRNKTLAKYDEETEKIN